jgi:hypothetical protein
MAAVEAPIDLVAPWAALVAWWLVLSRLCRRWEWLRSTAISVGLVIATLFADASVVVASARMEAPGGRPFAAFVLWIAGFMSVTTFTVLRAPSGGATGDGGSPTGGSEPPEPPWWPDFEREFRDYAGRDRRPGPRTPAGRA